MKVVIIESKLEEPTSHMTQDATERRLFAWSTTLRGAFVLGRGEEIVIVVLSDAEVALQRSGGVKPAEVERAC